MSSTSIVSSPRSTPRLVLLGIGAFLAVEFSAIISVLIDNGDFTCRANWPGLLCDVLGKLIFAGYGGMGALILYFMLVPAVLRTVSDIRQIRLWPLVLNAAGVCLALLPRLVLQDVAGSFSLPFSLAAWTLAVPMILAGAFLAFAPAVRWRAVLTSQGVPLLACMAIGAAIPLLAVQLQPFWERGFLTDITFSAVAQILTGFGYEVVTDPREKLIGAGDFFVLVGGPCSGIEGMALVTLFVTLYLALFRQQMRFPRVLILYPLGLAASFGFNILRIVVLVMIGVEGYPELAIGGFHSHAGWLTFMLVALGMVALAEMVPQFKRETARPAAVTRAASTLPPLRRDPIVARLLPFAVFMLSALVASTLSQTPGMLYPARMACVAAVLALFWPIYRMLPWRLDPIAAGAGLVIGLFWILIPVPEAASPAHGGLAGMALVLWYVARGIGTIVVVPLVEELFFRDYLESRIRLGSGLPWVVGAAFASAGLFALLHDRWAEAFVAGLILSAVAWRRGNITDAILAHALANAVVFSAALHTGNLALI